jgi:hypothetical protein
MSLQSPFEASYETTRLEVLQAAQPALVCRLLHQFGSATAVYRDAIIADAPAGIAALHAALHSAMSALPAELHRALAMIGDMTTEAGREQILSAATERREAIRADRSNAAELAFIAYLDHPLVFDLAYARTASGGTRRYAVFSGAHGPIARGSAMDQRSRLTNAVSGWLGLLIRAAVFDVRVNEATGDVSFLVLYDRSPVATGVIEGARTRISCSTATTALVTYYGQCGLLCVRADTMPERNAYRRIFGRALFGDEDWFQVTTVFTADPLMERGIESISVDGVRGIDSTVLCGVNVVSRDRHRTAVQLKAADLAGTLDSPLVQSVLARGTIRSMNLAMWLSGHRRPVVAEIAPPNELVINSPVAVAAEREVVRDFLVTRGFMRLIPFDSRPA